MQKVLIISYFFPPCNFVGGERTSFWAENLYKENIYPIIITRNWNERQKDIIGKVENNNYTIDQNKKREIHYLKYKHQPRDFVKNINLLRKIFTLIQQLCFYIIPKSVNYYNFYKKSYELLNKNDKIKTVIISGRPFEAFYFGYKLKKKFPHINWVPDYRDQWNTYQDKSSKSILTKCFSLIEKKLEKKWTSNSTFFISTTPEWTSNICDFINKKGEVILNGFDGEIIDQKEKKETDILSIIYAGTLYPNQEIESFLEIISKLNSKNNKISIEFIGCEMIPSQKERLEKLKDKHIGAFKITNRLQKKELQNKLIYADLYYLTSFANVKGWYPVKLFEYARFPNPIILFPSDNDIMNDFIKKTKTGFSINQKKDLESKLIELINFKANNTSFSLEKNFNELSKFSRSYQTSKLAKILKK